MTTKQRGRCRSCEAEVIWVTLTSGKKMPVDWPGESRLVRFKDTERFHVQQAFLSHFATCPDADNWRAQG